MAVYAHVLPSIGQSLVRVKLLLTSLRRSSRIAVLKPKAAPSGASNTERSLSRCADWPARAYVSQPEIVSDNAIYQH